MADDTLQQAIGLVKAGKDSEARGLLYHLVKTDPHNEMAWLWLSETMNGVQRKSALEQALKFNPESTKIQHALARLRAQQEQAAPKPPAPPAEAPRPAPPIPTPSVDRSTMQTAQLTFLPEDDDVPPPSSKKATPPAAIDDRSQIRTAQLPPLESQIDRTLMRAARYDISPDTLTPDKLPPELQLPGKPQAPKRSDQTDIKTSQLSLAPDGPVGKPVLPAGPASVPPNVQAQPEKNVPPPVQAPPPDKIDRSLMRAARFEQAEPTKTGPLHVPPPAAPAPDKIPPKTASAAAAAVAAQVVIPLPAPPPAAKPPAKDSEAPQSPIKQQMDALLTESHPSPDPVQQPKKTAAPPPPTFPPVKEVAVAPKGKPRRRLSGLEIFLIIIAVLLMLGIAGFLAWDFFGPKPVTPTAAVLPPAATLATATQPATNTPQATTTPIPPPTLRPTFTPVVSPTPTLNPDSPSILFLDPASCAVRQVSAGGGASQLMTESVPENCLAPELSADGLKYAYRLQTRGSESTNSLYVTNVNGSPQTAVIDKGESPIWEVDWAPDNIWLSYTAQVGTSGDKPVIGIYLIRSDGTNQLQLTDADTPSIIPVSNTTVSWSPDGQRVAFYADNRPYIVKPNGTGLDQLSEDAGQSIMAWSPDSRQIAFYSSDLNAPGIVVLGIDGKRSFVKNADLKVPVSGDALSWTPDGKQFIAYDVAQKALVLVSRDGTQVEPLVPVGGIPTRLAWSPDGTQLAYIELLQQDSSSGVLKAVNLGSKDMTILATSAANAPIRWKLPVNFTGTVTPAPVILVPTPTPSPTP